MKTNILIFQCIFVCLSFNISAFSQDLFPIPLKYISSCQIDLNNDDQEDIALLVETRKGRELIVLMKTKTGYDSYLVRDNISEMYLSWQWSKTVTETKAGNGEGKTYTTPGSYLELYDPERYSYAYFWNGNGFTEVYTSD